MIVEMLDRVYGHHHPQHLRQATHAIGFRRSDETLAVSLSQSKLANTNTTQVIENVGGGRSHMRTILHP
jgi:hypothetical protein